MARLSEIAKAWGTSPQYVCMMRRKGCPVDTVEGATAWRKANASKRAPTINDEVKPEPVRGRPPKTIPPSKSGDSLLDALNNSIACSDAAFKAYQKAAAGNLSTQSVRLSEHSKATQARLQCEKSYREEQERRGVLVVKNEIVERCRRSMEAVLRRLNKLPGESGPQCNEQEPLKAVTILQRAVNEIKQAAQAAFHDL